MGFTPFLTSPPNQAGFSVSHRRHLQGVYYQYCKIYISDPNRQKPIKLLKTKAQTDKYIAAYKLKDGKSKTKKKHGIFSRPSLKMVKTRLLEYETIIQILSQTNIRKPFRNSIRSHGMAFILQPNHPSTHPSRWAFLCPYPSNSMNNLFSIISFFVPETSHIRFFATTIGTRFFSAKILRGEHGKYRCAI